jgi:glutathione synthase/RimK-type ligase-like ATP-grasp enzyme
MIVVWGSREDPPAACMLEELRARGRDVVHLEDADLATLRYDVALGPTPQGWIEMGGRRITLDTIDAMYLRPGPHRPPRATAAAACLLALASGLPAVVVNRPTAGRSNLTKPFQLAAIADAGFAVPPTIVTTDPGAARAFLDRHHRIVYKSISGVRSIVATLEASAADRLAEVSSGPVQLQRWIEGIDVRVHVVGQRWFAAAIESSAADYRYPTNGGHDLAIVATDIDGDIGERLVRLAASMGLLVAGIDLRLTPHEDWFCFEVNPSPGFTFYEDATGQPIAAAIADLLTTSPS